MGNLQNRAETVNPNALNMTKVASYERVIHANLERVWENVLDWEHLPHLHSDSFDYIELDDCGDWGWRTFSDREHKNHIELSVADNRSYVSRTYSNGRQNAEIWTYLEPSESDTSIRVEFLIPDVDPARKDALGHRMLSLYERLWDEDERMMQERQHRLDEDRKRGQSIDLGQRSELKLPHPFQLAGREYVLDAQDGSLQVLPTICPHLLGPLARSKLNPGELVCPWHGYRFNLRSGDCVSPAGATCRLPPIPGVTEDATGKLIARLK